MIAAVGGFTGDEKSVVTRGNSHKGQAKRRQFHLMKVVIADHPQSDLSLEENLLNEAGMSMAVAEPPCRTPDEVIRAAVDAEALVLQYAPVTEDVLVALPRLHIVSLPMIGVDPVDVEAARRHGVWVANVPDACVQETAVHAFAMALGLIRHLPFLDRTVRAGDWGYSTTGRLRRPGNLVFGIVGLGRIGAVPVAINTALKGNFLTHVLTNTGCRIGVFDPDYLGWLADIEENVPDLETVYVLGEGDVPVFKRIKIKSFDEILAGKPDDIDVEVTYRDIGTIMFTSGTTGPSKGVLMPHGHLYLFGEAVRTHMRITPTDKYYITLPLFHVQGLTMMTYGTMIAGATGVSARTNAIAVKSRTDKPDGRRRATARSMGSAR